MISLKTKKNLLKKDTNYLLFLFFREVLSIFFKENKSICQGQLFVHLTQVTGSTYCEIVFQTMYTSRIRT